MALAKVCGVVNSYTVLWTNDLCQKLIRDGFTGQRGGRLLRSISLRGIYRLAPDSVETLSRHLTPEAVA